MCGTGKLAILEQLELQIVFAPSQLWKGAEKEIFYRNIFLLQPKHL